MRWYKLKHEEAKKELKYALENQKTINTLKLTKILQSMNFNLKQDGEDEKDRKIEFLKGEIRMLHRKVKRVKKEK